ncbi:MAG: glutathione S-transferase family protein [Sphingomonadaceae bacterium]|nr:glutathione S-transferase family protein [Sphingomonadaceae bacterium]
MPIDPNAAIEVTAFKWVPDFARGFVRDLRVRWALEEIGLPYRVRLIGGEGDRPADYWLDQPFGQVPVYKEGDLTLFESGAILIHIGEKDERLLPRDANGRARAIMWLIAALNSIEPQSGQLTAIDVFDRGAEWGKLRRPRVVEIVEQRLSRLSDWLGGKEWLEGRFTVGDIMMVDALRGISDDSLLARHANLAAYVARGTARPAFRRAMDAQIANFAELEAA